jgi:hypothetical protein
MDKGQFINLVSEITAQRINILVLENQSAKKDYEKTFIPFDVIEEKTKYLVLADNDQLFEFKTGKLENLLKTFISQYISIYATKITRYNAEGDTPFTCLSKAECLAQLCVNSRRLTWGLSYSTNYGIGIWQIFMSNDNLKEIKTAIENLLSEKGFTYRTETSEAGWVWRYIITGNSFLDNNLLIEQLQKNS